MMKALISIFVDSVFKVISDGFPWIIALLSIYVYTSPKSQYLYANLIVAAIALLVLFQLKSKNKIKTNLRKHSILVHLASISLILIFLITKDYIIFQAVLISIPPAIIVKELADKYLNYKFDNFDLTTTTAINSGTVIGLIFCFLYLNNFKDNSSLIEKLIIGLMAIRMILTYSHQLSALTLKSSLISTIKTIYLFRKSILWDSQFYKNQIDGINRYFPFLHYLMVGYWEGARTSKTFNLSNYIFDNPDLCDYNGSKLFHAVLHGIKEQRIKSDIYNYCYEDKILLINHEKNNILTPISLHIHAYYDEELRYIIEKVKEIDIIDEVIITIPFDSKVSEFSEIEVLKLLENKSKKELIKIKNKGANFYPFLKLINESKITNQVVCHLHTKRSPHLSFGKDWFIFLIDSLLPSESKVEQYSRAFSNDPRLGLLIPKYYKDLPNQPDLGKNKLEVYKLMQRYQVHQKNVCDYPCGGMFFARKEIFHQFSNIVKAPNFTNGALSADGNFEHAIERFIGHLPNKYGKITRFVNHGN